MQEAEKEAKEGTPHLATMIGCTPELTIAREAMPTPGIHLPTAVQ